MKNVSQYANELAALGHKSRLEIYRLLVKAGHNGLNVGEIAKHTKLHNSTLAHHITALVDTKLVTQKRKGREIVSVANYTKMNQLTEFLMDECCKGIE